MGALQVWFMTTGEAGYRTQARGLARAIAPDARELVVGLRPPWSWLPGAIAPMALSGLDPAKDIPHPPWPDLLVTCGRRAATVSIAIRKASGGRTLTAHVQNPLTDLGAFDLVVALDHDRIAGRNVISFPTALHDVTAARLEAARAEWAGRLKPDGRPLLGVLLGGSTRRGAFTPGDADRLLSDLGRVRGSSGARLALTPSRRTPATAQAHIARRLASDPDAFVWDFQGDNPYLGILALSDRLVVTGDSVSMTSEALATGACVEVFGRGGGRRADDFLDGLIRRGLVRAFAGESSPPPRRPPVDATVEAAQALRAVLAARTGVSG